MVGKWERSIPNNKVIEIGPGGKKERKRVFLFTLVNTPHLECVCVTRRIRDKEENQNDFPCNLFFELFGDIHFPH